MVQREWVLKHNNQYYEIDELVELTFIRKESSEKIIGRITSLGNSAVTLDCSEKYISFNRTIDYTVIKSVERLSEQ